MKKKQDYYNIKVNYSDRNEYWKYYQAKFLNSTKSFPIFQ